MHVCAGGIWVPGEGRKAVVGAWLLCRKRVRGGAKAAERPGQVVEQDVPPARDRDPGLPGRDEDGCEPAGACGPIELERHRHLPDGAVGADREHDQRVDPEVRADVSVFERLRVQLLGCCMLSSANAIHWGCLVALTW